MTIHSRGAATFVVRNIARNQHDEARQEVSREVNKKIIMNARSEVDSQGGPRFTEMATTIRGRAWDPLVRLGLDPTTVKLEMTASIASARLQLEEFVAFLCDRLGVEPRQPDDLPEGVTVTFAAEQPVRIDCRGGLMHVRVALDALESGRRNWYDIIAQVANRPVR